MNRYRTLAVVFIAATACLAEDVHVALTPQSVITTRLRRGVVGTRERQATIQSLFEDAGCTPEIQPVNKKSGNVICTLPGQTASTIVVGGHFDFVEDGRGIVDDWSGAALLSSLYEGLKTQPRQHTYVFVAFAAEETGLNGSARYVQRLTPDQKSRIHAFVNLECLGVGTVNMWLSRADRQLAARAVEVANAIGVRLQAVNVDQAGDDDSHSFLAAGLPVITFHSLTQATIGIIHSPRDKLDAIRPDNYYDAYKLASYYLAWLDAKIA